MKLRKVEICLICMALVFSALVIGVSIGARSQAHLEVSVQRSGDPAPALPQQTVEEKTEELVNINSAGIEELCTLKGIGEVTAERIIAYREENGPFTDIRQITNVEGIGPGKYEDIRGYITLE